MKVKNILILSLGGPNTAPIASAKGLFDKYSARHSVQFIAWFHLNKEDGHYTRRRLYRNQESELKAFDLPEFDSFGKTELEAATANKFYKDKYRELDEFKKVRNVPGELIPPADTSEIKWPAGDMGAIIVAHGSVSSAGSLSSSQLADMLSKFRCAYKVPPLRKVVFDVCSVGRVGTVAAPKVPKGDGRSFYALNRSETGVVNDLLVTKLVEGAKLSFLQDFLYKYGELCLLAGESVEVKVAGWDEGVSVYHPDNELNREINPTSTNREEVEGLSVGQKYLAYRAGHRAISDAESIPIYNLEAITPGSRRVHKRMYNYVICNDVHTVTELRLDQWHDLEFA
ncbi:hypothetical protein J3D54_000230 [Pseudomonas sp. GGS8]|uniref:hypothetical protein n=1 Tax=Pseudomonas sp. GGS8 TaxID=2817892 RepID=UPI00209E647D|nr:hypothetical protein [Pseudomonas sp. GGS8]MCP1441098.1 hypothetical protein [Pseudomonas sp. GGS8]